MATIRLCKCPELDINYENVVDFPNKNARWNWFEGRCFWKVETEKKDDELINSMVLDLTYDQTITQADYLFFLSSSGREFYFFIKSMEINTGTSIKLNLDLDVWTTYHLDLEYQPSFIERCHVNRWDSSGVPSMELVDEGFPNFPTEIKSKDKMQDFNGIFIYTSGSPLGKMSKTGTGGEVDPTPPPIVGTDLLDGDGNSWGIPTSGKVTAQYPDYPVEYQEQLGRYHGGFDIAGGKDKTVVCVDNGLVISRKISSVGYGNHVIIEHTGNRTGLKYRFIYAHLNNIDDGIEQGSIVRKGQYIGNQGATGNVTGVHLHLEQRKDPYRAGGNNVGGSGYSTGDTVNPATNYKIGDYVG